MNARAPASRPPDDIRHVVRSLLTASTDYHTLDPQTQRDIASALVRISSTARVLADEGGPPRQTIAPVPARVLAQTQAAGDAFSGTAIDRIAPTTQNILNAVSFPRFVAELITGVFKAMNDSNQQQLTAYVDLIRNVAATTEGFADANMGLAGARAWLAERFPESFVVSGDDTDEGFDDPEQMTPEERAEAAAERDENTRLQLRPNASMPSEGALRTALGLGPAESVPSGSPESLVGPARAALARNRQQILASMVMMGMQRIVIDSGRLNASMRFHIDASSAASDDRGSTFDARHTSEVGAKFGAGPWGASAKMQNTIGYVTTERTQTEEELNAELDLSSSVELIFRTDYVPLERLAGTGDVNRIRVNTINPTEEARLASEERRAREERRGTARTARRAQTEQTLAPRNQPGAMTPLEVPDPPGESGTETGGGGNTAAAPTPAPAAAEGGGGTEAAPTGGESASAGGETAPAAVAETPAAPSP